MDDAGFEQAVWELTSDKHHLIAGFAGGMKYDTPQITENFKEIILNDPLRILQRIWENQKSSFFKIFLRYLWNAIKLFGSNDSRFGKNIFISYLV